MAHGRFDLTEFEWNVISRFCRTRRGAFNAILVERCINKLKQFRHIATRYDRYASAYPAFAKLGAIRLWLRFL